MALGYLRSAFYSPDIRFVERVTRESSIYYVTAWINSLRRHCITSAVLSYKYSTFRVKFQVFLEFSYLLAISPTFWARRLG